MYLLILPSNLLLLAMKIEVICNSINNTQGLNASIKEHGVFGRYISITSELYTDKFVSNIISEITKQHNVDCKNVCLLKELSENKCIGM
jgi:hypothetical protein